VPLEQASTARGAQIIDSNGVGLAAAVRAAGGVPIDGGIVRDDLAAFASALGELAVQADLVLSAGGVSGGDFDFAKAAIARAGGTVHFWKVRCRPGSQLAFGELGGKPWIGLPGNPVSALVGFEVFGRPLVRTMLGDTTPFRRLSRAVLEEPLRGDPDVTLLLRGQLTHHADGPPSARRSGAQGSHIHSSLARADVLLVVPAGITALAAGETVAILPLDDRHGLSAFPDGVT
jgi:molybdopterin molybdotransferase